MKTWNQLLNRHGWNLEQLTDNTFNCVGETKGNMAFLVETLVAQEVNYFMDNSTLILDSFPVNEENWLKTVAFDGRGHQGFWFEPGEEEAKLKELDAHIAGIVRQLNRLGFFTSGSCDGHGDRRAYVMITKDREINELIKMLSVFGMKRINYRESSRYYTLLLPFARHKLLDLAEKLSLVE